METDSYQKIPQNSIGLFKFCDSLFHPHASDHGFSFKFFFATPHNILKMRKNPDILPYSVEIQSQPAPYRIFPTEWYTIIFPMVTYTSNSIIQKILEPLLAWVLNIFGSWLKVRPLAFIYHLTIFYPNRVDGKPKLSVWWRSKRDDKSALHFLDGGAAHYWCNPVISVLLINFISSTFLIKQHTLFSNWIFGSAHGSWVHSKIILSENVFRLDPRGLTTANRLFHGTTRPRSRADSFI